MQATQLRVLIVDDSPEDREFYRRLLKRASAEEFADFQADTGEEGLQMAGDLTPDCVLLDYNLPDLDGLEFIVRLRALPALSGVAVVMLTGQGDERVAVEAMKRGAQDYLIKGDLTFGALSRAVRNAVSTTSLSTRLLLKQNDLEQVVHMATHDLKAPIGTIERAVDVLAGHLGDGIDDRGRVLLDDIRSSARGMGRLVDGLQNFAQLGRDACKRERVNLMEVLRDTLAELEADLQAAQGRVVSEPLPTILADGVAVRSLFRNLILNALQNRGGDPPVVRIGSSERDDVCEFWFADNGVGVDVADRERIFAPFQRLAPAQHEGLGLGLATCREVVAAHGGRIWVDSVPSIGSTFRFTLLRPQGGATPPPALAADGAPSSAPLGGPGTVDRSTPANLTQR